MTAYHSSLSVFMSDKNPSGTKRHCESTEPESRQTLSFFFF